MGRNDPFTASAVNKLNFLPLEQLFSVRKLQQSVRIQVRYDWNQSTLGSTFNHSPSLN